MAYVCLGENAWIANEFFQYNVSLNPDEEEYQVNIRWIVIMKLRV